eukprot:175819_1
MKLFSHLYDEDVLHTLNILTKPMPLPEDICLEIAEYSWCGVHFQSVDDNKGLRFAIRSEFEHYYEQLRDIFNSPHGFCIQFKVKLNLSYDPSINSDWLGLAKEINLSNPSAPIKWDENIPNDRLEVLSMIQVTQSESALGILLGAGEYSCDSLWHIKQVSDVTHHIQIHVRYDKWRKTHKLKIKCSESLILKPLIHNAHSIRINDTIMKNLHSHSCGLHIGWYESGKDAIYDVIIAKYSKKK